MIEKRIFDVIFSFLLLAILSIPIFIIWIITCICLRSNGLFFQTRIGQYSKPFTIYKFRTMNSDLKVISKWGVFLRKTKVDELLQLLNILKGDMSFVGPRPDISGYYDILKGEYRVLLQLKPGLTSEAALKYFNEEKILVNKKDPKEYNNEVIYLDKIKMNLHYYYNRSFFVDLKTILKTLSFFLDKKNIEPD